MGLFFLRNKKLYLTIRKLIPQHILKKKSNYFLIALCVILFCSCKSKEPINTPKNKPNIILFFVDDMGWQDTSVQFWNKKTVFNNLYATPNMEKLAKEGMKFTQAYATPVCTPTRVSLISGMNAARHKVTNWTLKRDTDPVAPPKGLKIPKWNVNGVQSSDSIPLSVHITPLQQILKDNGYLTIHSGKAHWGAMNTPGEDPKNLGFDINIAGHAAGAPGSYFGTKNFKNSLKKSSIWDVPGLEKYHGKDIFLTEALTQEAIIAMDKAINVNKPFYLHMAHYAVHTPIQGDFRFEQKYLDLGMHKTEAKYASLIEGMDKSLGDLMEHLEKKGIADNTIILFMSDNGGLSAVARGGEKHTHNKPLSSGKGSVHEGGIREPMLVKWPKKVKKNSVTNAKVIIEDFFPTILEMAEINNYKTVQEVDGISFTNILKGKELENDNRALFWHYPNNWGPTGPGIGATSTIRKGDWKLIYYHINRAFELFNIKNDIGETTNLALREKIITKDLAKTLGSYLRSVDAQMPTDTNTNKLVPWPDQTKIIKQLQ
jgi:arylsulfatase A-like enzyme